MSNGKHTPDGSKSYQGPYIDPRTFFPGPRGADDFTDDQAFVDATYIIEFAAAKHDGIGHLLNQYPPAPGVPPGTTATGDLAQARKWLVNGAVQNWRVGTLGLRPFETHPVTQSVKDAVAAVNAWAQGSSDSPGTTHDYGQPVPEGQGQHRHGK